MVFFLLFYTLENRRNVNQHNNLNLRDLISFTLPKTEFGISVVITIMAQNKSSAQSNTGTQQFPKNSTIGKKKFIYVSSILPPMAVVDSQNWKPPKVLKTKEAR